MQKVLSSRFEKQNLVVMVSMVAQVAALFTNQFAMHATKGYIGLIVELTSAKRRRLVI